MEETKGENTDLGRSEFDRRDERDSRSEENETQIVRHDELMAQSSAYPVRPGVEDCQYYLKNGRCGFRARCRFNHPPLTDESNQMRHGMVQTCMYPVRLGVPDCEHYVNTGLCSYGSNCRYNHPPPTHLSAPVVRPERFRKRNCKYFQSGSCKHGSSCAYLHQMDVTAPLRRATNSDWRFDERRQGTESSSMAAKRERTIPDPRESSQDNKRVRIEQAQENVQRRENVEERRLREQEQEQADIERNMKEAQEKAEEERRQRDVERRQARLRNEQMRPSVTSDNVDQIRETLTDIGIERKDGDGF